MVKTKSIWADTEKKFFESLKNHFPKNDYVKLNYFIIPESHSCNLNRFYRPSDAFWFSRLKVSSSETFYYFGFGLDNEDEINPNLSLIANQDIKKSHFRFLEDNVYCLVEVKRDSETFKELNKNFTLKYATKSKDNFFYVVLGNVIGEKFIENIKLLSKIINNFESFADRLNVPSKDNLSHKLSAGKIHESKPKVTKTLLEYNNGICTKEGMARNGKKFKKGSFKKRANNEGIRTLRLYSNIPYTPDESGYKSDFKYEI